MKKVIIVLAAAILTGCATNNQPVDTAVEFDGILAECYNSEKVTIVGMSGEVTKIYRIPCDNVKTLRL